MKEAATNRCLNLTLDKPTDEKEGIFQVALMLCLIAES